VMVGNPVLGVMIAREDKTPQAVWKFQLGHHDTRTEVEMPRGAKIVEVAIPTEAHTHLGTVHVDVFVFHVFEGFQ
jgi:hypothetical protein